RIDAPIGTRSRTSRGQRGTRRRSYRKRPYSRGNSPSRVGNSQQARSVACLPATGSSLRNAEKLCALKARRPKPLSCLHRCALSRLRDQQPHLPTSMRTTVQRNDTKSAFHTCRPVLRIWVFTQRAEFWLGRRSETDARRSF